MDILINPNFWLATGLVLIFAELVIPGGVIVFLGGGGIVVATDHTEYASKIERVFYTAGFQLESKDMSEIWTTAYALKARKKNSGLKTFRFVRQ